MWIGTLFDGFLILRAHARAGGDGFAGLEKRIGRAMDVGATLTIGFGLALLLLPEGGTAVLKGAGYFHAKLTGVVLLIGVHGFMRVRLGKFSRGEGEGVAPPSAIFLAMLVLTLGILVLVFKKPF